MRYLLIIIFFPYLCYSQSLEEAQSLYNSGNQKKAILKLRALKKKNNKNLEIKKQLVNYYLWEEYTNLSKKESEEGYLLSKNKKNDYPYFFYDKKTSNRLLTEFSFTSGYLNDTYGAFIESSHNYDGNDWIFINYRYEYRKSSLSEKGDLLGFGLITFLNKDSYLYSAIYFSQIESFQPSYSIENEFFYFKGDNTYSLNIKNNAYKNNSSLIIFSPHFRHDFDKSYVGLRSNLTYTEKNILKSYQIYFGKAIDYRLRGEIGSSFGSSKEDGITTVVFDSYNAGAKYKLTHSLELGVKYNFYRSSSGSNDHSYIFNLLWKY